MEQNQKGWTRQQEPCQVRSYETPRIERNQSRLWIGVAVFLFPEALLLDQYPWVGTVLSRQFKHRYQSPVLVEGGLRLPQNSWGETLRNLRL